MSNYLDRLVRCLGYGSYTRYLLGEHWLAFSRSVRQKRCFCCGVGRDLQVHHITYDRLGRERASDVVTVCGGCHSSIHKAVKGGASLDNAHFSRKKSVQGAGSKKLWVDWRDLVNKSLGQTVAELQEFLEEKGLLRDGVAGEKAYGLKFVRKIDGKEKWHLSRYIKMMQAHNKIKKLKRQGKVIHPALCRQALVKC